jgi:hypothetical protein
VRRDEHVAAHLGRVAVPVYSTMSSGAMCAPSTNAGGRRRSRPGTSLR